MPPARTRSRTYPRIMPTSRRGVTSVPYTYTEVDRNMSQEHYTYGIIACSHGYTHSMTRDEILKLTHLVSCAG